MFGRLTEDIKKLKSLLNNSFIKSIKRFNSSLKDFHFHENIFESLLKTIKARKKL